MGLGVPGERALRPCASPGFAAVANALRISVPGERQPEGCPTGDASLPTRRARARWHSAARFTYFSLRSQRSAATKAAEFLKVINDRLNPAPGPPPCRPPAARLSGGDLNSSWHEGPCASGTRRRAVAPPWLPSLDLVRDHQAARPASSAAGLCLTPRALFNQARLAARRSSLPSCFYLL